MTCVRAVRLAKRYTKKERTPYVKRWICRAVCFMIKHIERESCSICQYGLGVFYEEKPPVLVDFQNHRRIA